MNDGDGPDHDDARRADRDDARPADRDDGGADEDVGGVAGTDGDAAGTDGDGGAAVQADRVADDPDDGREWEYSLEDIQQREDDAAAEVEAAERRRQPLEPGDPSLEGVVFVLLGVLLTLFILSRLVVG